MNYWLVKQEPTTYSWDDFVAEGKTNWTGVRNYQARNNLKQMLKGDFVLFYHSGNQPEIVGIAKVTRESFQDPTSGDERWIAVEISPVKKLEKAVSLMVIKKIPALSEISLLKQSRLSVMPIAAEHFDLIKLISHSD